MSFVLKKSELAVHLEAQMGAELGELARECLAPLQVIFFVPKRGIKTGELALQSQAVAQ